MTCRQAFHACPRTSLAPGNGAWDVTHKIITGWGTTMGTRASRAAAWAALTALGTIVATPGLAQAPAVNGDDGAKPCDRRPGFDPLGGVRLFPGLRRRRSMARNAGPLVPLRHDHGQHQSRREDDSGSPVHALPDDVRDHHRRAGGGVGCRPDEVFGLSAVLDRLVHGGLRAAGAL